MYMNELHISLKDLDLQTETHIFHSLLKQIFNHLMLCILTSCTPFAGQNSIISVYHCFTITSISLQFYLSFTSCKSWNYSINTFLPFFTCSVVALLPSDVSSLQVPPVKTFYSFLQVFIYLLSPFLPNFFLCQDRCHGDVPPHLVQPCYVALGVIH